ncbi:hypothetical protein N7462_009067 [Penicillium macrosclerotiorum]|uniref:uncharacterized protein n=1 Tax=Penicillium macrosclerotiorum TaxID=303699 RepID=UPI00254761A9|nr:uncharacterized protein N7462_009067 [Penicillium macrosclerotiorum]KAJ5676170.1 hypothetical protein N7462_009067 [Penicillium macrosclerotiorum]
MLPTSPTGAWFEHVIAAEKTNVDIVAIPPIGANHQKAWTAQNSTSPWISTLLIRRMPRARVLLYNHGDLREHDKIDDLGQRLLNTLLDERKQDSRRRPLFFLCHSTGGLVAKACLALASRAEPSQAILTSCHGIAFFATPHQGSTYLSADEYGPSIRRLLHLDHEIPLSLREQFRPRQERLWHLSNQFKALSADMKVWSFLETLDSTLHVMDMETGNTMEFHAPITSIISGLLGIEHENEIPLATDHVGTACFQGQETAQEQFLMELGEAVGLAVELSTHMDTPLRVEGEVMVQINGFFEDTALGVSDESPLKLWSTRVSLEDYLARGPSTCLRERLKRVQPGGLDDSSLSSFDSRYPSSHQAPGPDEHAQDPEQDHQIAPHQKDPRQSRPSMRRGESFPDPAPQSPTIHITEAAMDGYFDRSTSESPPPPRERKRASSIAKALGLAPLDSHKRNASDGSSQTSSSRPSSPSPHQAGFLSIPSSTRDRINQNAEARDIPRSVPRFDQPEPDTEKLLWIHVPYTHTGWVSQVIRRACKDRHEPNFLRKFINEENWYLLLNRARHREPHARFVRPKCIHSRQMDVSQGNEGGASDDPQLALYTPYLHWDRYRNLIQRRQVVEDRLRQGRSRPVPNRVAKSSLEAQLIWQYLGSEPPIHFRRTLDQYGYPNLRSTVARDDDQMLWKRTRKPSRIDDQLKKYLEASQDDPEEGDAIDFMDGNVLMVDQLWLWIVDQKTVITFFPNQEATTSEGKLFEQTNLHSSIYNELNGDLARRFETAGDLAALIMLHATTVLLDKTLHHDLQVLRIFEESISILTESVTKSFKRFRKMMTAAQLDARDRQTARRNRDDLSVLLELRDIEDELSTILKLLDQQDTVMKSMMKYFDRKGCGKVFLDAAQMRIDEYRTQIGDMKENSHLAQKAVETLLDLKQKQANVDESKMARWQAEETQNQSRSLMVFTIFTVMYGNAFCGGTISYMANLCSFLPLSFFTSLFGINAREWSGTEQNLTLAEMAEIAAPASFAIILIALLMAFSEKLRQIVAKSHKITKGLLSEFIFYPVKVFLHWESFKGKIPSVVPAEDSAMRKRFDNYLGYGNHRMNIDEDFWQRREGARRPLEELERKKRKRAKSIGWGEAISEKVRRVSQGGLNV